MIPSAATEDEPIPLIQRSSDPRHHDQSDEDDLENTLVIPQVSPSYSSSNNETRPKPRLRTRRPKTLRRTLYLLLEKPTSSQSAFTVHLLSNALIVLSALLTILETLPLFHAVKSGLWFGLETSIVVLFTIEYGARCIAWSEDWPTFWNWFTCKSTTISVCLANQSHYISFLCHCGFISNFTILY